VIITAAAEDRFLRVGGSTPGGSGLRILLQRGMGRIHK